MADRQQVLEGLRIWGPLFAPYIALGLPVVLLCVAGVYVLWNHALLLPWMLILLLSGFAAHLLFARARQRYARELPDQKADGNWEGRAASAWQLVEERARAISIDDWSDDATSYLGMARDVMADVASHLKPGSADPLLDVTVPHALHIIELASHDLRTEVVAAIPMSHRLTIADIGRGQALISIYGRMMELYRIGRLFFNPASALAQEMNRALAGQAMNATGDLIKTWLLREWVRKVGFHAINLYDGRVLLAAPSTGPRSATAKDIARAAEAAVQQEPLRLLLLGRAGVGKSSLVNALFDQPLAAVDVAGGTTREVTPFVLESDQLSAAMVFDTPPCDSQAFKLSQLRSEIRKSDAILVVLSAIRADRGPEQKLLRDLRQGAHEEGRKLPPIFAVVSQIDRLPPARSWSPPYDLTVDHDPKARNIAGAIAAIAQDLSLPPERVVPVSLRPGQTYNVSDVLMGCLADELDEIGQARLRRCHAEFRDAEKWGQLKQQFIKGGRMLKRQITKLPTEVLLRHPDDR